jgi:hypothetical protein
MMFVPSPVIAVVMTPSVMIMGERLDWRNHKRQGDHYHRRQQSFNPHLHCQLLLMVSRLRISRAIEKNA